MGAAAGEFSARWSALFGDLEAQFAAERDAQHAEEDAQRLRHDRGQHTLVQRLRATAGRTVSLGLVGRDPLVISVTEVGPDWLLGEDRSPARRECLVNVGAISWIEGLDRYVDVRDPGRVWAALDFRRALRALAQQRVPVSVAVADCAWEQGTFDAVYADHVDLARHPVGEPRRAGAITDVRALPLGAISAVRRLA